VVKINPLINQGVSATERFLKKPAADPQAKPGREGDVVNISTEARKKHIMGQLIARITAEAETKKG